MSNGFNKVLQRIREIDSKFSEREIKNNSRELDLFKVNSLSSFTPQSSFVKAQPQRERIPSNFEEVLKTTRERLPESSKNLIVEDAIQQAQKKTGISESLIRAVIKAESNGKANAISPAGAVGLMQIMPETAKELGIQNSFDPQQNVLGGAKYLKKLLKEFDNDLELTLAAYNAGPGNVKKFGGVPPYQETISYIQKVKKYLQEFLVS